MGVTQLITALVLGFAASALFTWREIPLLKKNQFKQYIREEGPESHKKKSGTPTMGGLSMIAALLIVTVLWTLGLYRAARAGNRRLLCVAVLVSIHALVEPQFMELVNNIFLLLPFTVLSDAARTAAGAADTLRPTDVRDPDNKKRMPLPALLAPALLLLLGFLMMPAWITHLHTIWEVLGWTGGRAAGVPVIAVLLLTLVIVVVTLVSSACALRHILSERNILSRPLVVTIAGAVCLIACHIAGSVLLMRAADAHTAIVEEDAQVLDAVLEEAEGAVYSSVLPYYYHARYGTMQQTMFTADDLARYDHTSVLTDADHDSLALMHRGFSYAEISGTHALYTNDAGVLRALDEAGIEYHPFFSRERIVRDTASYELHGGVYQVRFRLSAGKDTLSSADARDILCHLRMTSYYGEVVLFDVPLPADAFDRNGGYEDVTEITIGDERGVQFLVVPEEEADIRVEEIRFSRTE